MNLQPHSLCVYSGLLQLELLTRAVETNPEHGPAHGQLGLSVSLSILIPLSHNQAVQLLHTGKSSVSKAADHMQKGLGLMSIEDEGRTLVQLGYGA